MTALSNYRKLSNRVGRGVGESWPGHAWPGGYAIAYVTDDGESMCARCMNHESEIHFDGDADGWRIDGAVGFGADTDYPETDEMCAHCGAVIAAGMLADDDDAGMFADYSD